MSVLQDIYKRHLDATCRIGYESRTIQVPLNGRVYTFRFDDPVPHLNHADMLEGTRTMDVRAIMPLSEAWKILSEISETRFPCERFCIGETQDSRLWGTIAREMKTKLTNEGNRYSADRATMNHLVAEWSDFVKKGRATEYAIHHIWIPENSTTEICTPIPAAGLNYEFKTKTRGAPGHVIEFIGDLEKAILPPK